MNVVVALPPALAARLAADFEDAGLAVVATIAPDETAAALGDPASPLWDALSRAEAIVVPASRGVLTAGLIGACDRHGVRVVALADRPSDVRIARAFGIAEPLPATADGWRIAAAVRDGRVAEPGGRTMPGAIVAVWGPHGAPGRTTTSIELAVETARRHGHVALVDADTHAPSVAIALGLADEGPGFAAACRQAEIGALDAAELTRLSIPVGGADGVVDVLTGLNRAGRWPELSERRVSAALDACRSWADLSVVDVAASLEADEEIASDLVDGPRRNAAAQAALREADVVVAVASADPVGIARFLRGYAELRAVVGTAPVHVVVNRLRSGPLGIDPRGQVRRTLDRFAGIADVHFLPDDGRAADAAMLQARPVGEIAPRSALSQAVRRVAARVAETALPVAGRAPA